MENLLKAWKEFKRGKSKKEDVQEFELRLMSNILSLHNDLKNKTYKHSSYKHFKISDPKSRDIHKALVKDRLLHHAIYRILYPYFDKKFIADSYSCRNYKGTHKAVKRFRYFANKVSKNNTKTCWVLKCDVKKFFASIEHNTLKKILEKYISDKDILWLLFGIIDSFNSIGSGSLKKGLPLGNLTSQLFVNIYMNEFDQWMKHTIKEKYYIRYADDFVILSGDKDYLLELIFRIDSFLSERLKLDLHPKKISVKTLASGVDFLGWVNFTDHRVLRTNTKRRMLKRLKYTRKKGTLQSYLGLLSHGNGYKLQKEIRSKK